MVSCTTYALALVQAGGIFQLLILAHACFTGKNYNELRTYMDYGHVFAGGATGHNSSSAQVFPAYAMGDSSSAYVFKA